MRLSAKPFKKPKKDHVGEKKCAIALDVGGTFLKSALVTSKGSILEKTPKRVPIDSQGSAESIIETFVQTLKPHLEMTEDLGLELAGIGVGIPGPFDYGGGISLMKHKFSTIYGINLKQELIKRLGLRKSFPIRFENDAWTFLRGEAWLGAARDYTRIIGLTIGTGLGSAFMVGNRVIIEGPGVPPYGSIYNLPYEDGIVEDKISRRGIIARYEELTGRRYRNDLDVREIALRGIRYKDGASLQVFEEVGRRLGQVLKPIVSEFRADCLVFGGQISKSFSLFSNHLKDELQQIYTLKKIVRARMIDSSPIYGAAKLIFLGSTYRPPVGRKYGKYSESG
jgi:glucokinase